MKNLKIIILVMTLVMVAPSCESYDDYPEKATVVGFTRQNMNINGVGGEGSSKSAEVIVFASDYSSSDRTYNVTDIEIDNPLDFPPTDRTNFDYEPTVTIPAGELNGTIIVTGINTTLTSDRTYFRLSIENDPNVVAGSTITIGLRQ